MVCDSLALGTGLQMQPHVEEKHQDSGPPSPSGLDENNSEARPPSKSWARAPPFPQLSNVTWTLSYQAGALRWCRCSLTNMCFNLGKEEVGGGWEKKHIWGWWVEYGNCQQLPALSHITPPCCVPPTGCTEELAGLVEASHAQNCHCCVTVWLPPAPSDAHSDSDDFHCMQGSLTALTGVQSLPQTWHRSHTQETAQ